MIKKDYMIVVSIIIFIIGVILQNPVVAIIGTVLFIVFADYKK